MKNVSIISSVSVRMFMKKLVTSIAFLALIALSVPQGAFAQEATDTPPADIATTTDTTTTDTATVTTISTTTDSTVPTPDQTSAGAASTASTTATTTDSGTPRTNQVADVQPTCADFGETGTYPDCSAPQQACTLVSDTTTLHNNQPSVLVSPINALWTAVLNGASWIWGENPNGDPVNGSTETFTKTFTLSSIPTSASIVIAADNSYSATVNGHAIASDPGEVNYSAAGQDTVSIPTADLQVGTNTLSVTVTNFPMGGGTMATNPAGLLYTLTVNGSNCNTPPPPPAPFTVVATKVVCDSEADLPNWGKGGHIIGATTATDYVASHPGCHLQPGWQFEWGSSTTTDAGDSFIGPAGNGYATFGPTNASGTASVQIPSDGNSEVHLREVLQNGYIPFTFTAHPDNSDDVSAEFYCKDDALNYDNYDFIRRAQPGQTYYCVGFNAPTHPVTPTTSTVKVCKVNDTEGHTPLSGWTLMLKGAHVGSVTVAPDGVDHPLANVPAGNYILTASGNYVYRPNDVAASTSDAAYSLRLPSDSVYGGPYAPWVRENNFPNPNTGWLGIMLNSSFTDWGSVFHPDHVYATSTALAATSTMNFKILDDVYTDNSGSLNVSVDHGYVGITGENGCTTFQNVPAGSYTTVELNQDGWSNVSGIGPVTVASTSETFTIVNHHGGDNGGETTHTDETIVVRATDLGPDFATALASSTWEFYNDTNDTVDNSIGSFVNGPGTPPLGDGSAEFTLGSNPMDRKDVATFQFSGTPLAHITSLGYSAYSHSGVAGPNESPYLVFNVDFSGSSSAFQGRLVWVPINNQGSVAQDTWNTFDTINGGAGKWVYSGATWPITGQPGTTAKTWSQILADYPSARILPAGGLLGIRVGEPGPSGYTADIDNVTVGIKTGSNTDTKTYDFEPTKSIDITPPGGGGNGGGGGTSGRSGSSISTFAPVGQVLGASTTTVPTCGPILFSFLRIGHSNPASQVKVLQTFLNSNLSLDLPVSGFFGSMTEKAVEQFQAKYFSDVLTPWVPHGLPSEHSVTGYVYKTTKRKVNLVNCPSLDIPLPKLP